MKRGDIVELQIDSIAFGGQGVARYSMDDRQFTIFVDGTVPGDRVLARIGGRKRSHAFGYVDTFLEKAPHRVTPQCRHFGDEGDRCGGCSLQSISYEDQLRLKEQQVRDAIERIGHLDGSMVAPILGVDDPWNYRNKMEFSFSRTEEGKLSLGLHVKRRHHDVVELTECHLFSPYVGDLVTVVRDFFRRRDLTDEPTLRSLMVREGKNTGDILVNLMAENGEATFLDEFTSLVREFFEEKGKLTSLYYTLITNIKGQPKCWEERLLWGEPTIRESLMVGDNNELTFAISPRAFFQPNTKQAEKLFALAVKAAGLSGNEVVYDLYCGAGTIALACARSAKHVYGIEINESALNNARDNALTNAISNVTFEVGDVAKELPHLPDAADVVMVDPPRSGLHPDVVAHICEMAPQRVVYVSCNPSTLARDLQIFTKTGYSLESVQPVDMFPQTYHIENVALLNRS